MTWSKSTPRNKDYPSLPTNNISCYIWFLTKSHFCHKSVKIHYISYLLVCLKHLKHSVAMESFFLSKISISAFDWIDSPFERFIYADDKHSENSFGVELSPFDAK